MDGYIVAAGIAACVVGWLISRRNPTFFNSFVMPLIVGAIVVAALFLVNILDQGGVW